MYAQYDGLIFDMDGTLRTPNPRIVKPDRRPGRYGMRFDLQAMIALNGSPRRIAQAVIELNQADLDPHLLARENRCGKSHAFRYGTSVTTD